MKVVLVATLVTLALAADKKSKDPVFPECAEKDIDYALNDIVAPDDKGNGEPVPGVLTVAGCGKICMESRDCKFWTVYLSSQQNQKMTGRRRPVEFGDCFLKNSSSGRKEYIGAYSGAKGCRK